jgi:hypothetical protein
MMCNRTETPESQSVRNMIEQLEQLPAERRLYILVSLVGHLTGALQLERLHRLLTNFDFVEARTMLDEGQLWMAGDASTDVDIARDRSGSGVFRLLADYDAAIEAFKQPAHAVGEVVTMSVQVETLRDLLWAETAAIAARPEITVQQLFNRLQMSSQVDAQLETQASNAVGQRLAAGSAILISVLHASSAIGKTQHALESAENIITVNHVPNGYGLWSRSGAWRLVSETGALLDERPPLSLPPLGLVASEHSVVAVYGRTINCWPSWPDGQPISLTLPFAVEQLALSRWGDHLLVIGAAGRWSRFHLSASPPAALNSGYIGISLMCCALDEVGERWCGGGLDGALYVSDDHRLISITCHDGMVRCCAWHPGSDLIASGGQDNVLRLTRANGEPIRQHHCGAWVNHVAFSPDGAEVFAVTEGGKLFSLSVHDQSSEERIWAQEPVGLAQVCVGGRNEVAVLDTENRVHLIAQPSALAPTLAPAMSSEVCYLQQLVDGAGVLVVDVHGNVIKLDQQLGIWQSQTLATGTGSALAATLIAPDLLTIVYQDTDASRVTQIRLNGSRRQHMLWPERRWWQTKVSNATCTAAAFSSDSSMLALASRVAESENTRRSRVEIFTTRPWRKVGQVITDSFIFALAIAAEERRLVLGSALLPRPPAIISLIGTEALTLELSLERWNAAAMSVDGRALEGCIAAAISADGRTLVVVDRHGNGWLQHEHDEGREVTALGRPITCCSVSSSGRWVLIGMKSGEVRLFIRSHFREGRTVQRELNAYLAWEPTYCTVSEEQQLVYLGGRDALQIFRLAKGSWLISSS